MKATELCKGSKAKLPCVQNIAINSVVLVPHTCEFNVLGTYNVHISNLWWRRTAAMIAEQREARVYNQG